MPTRRNPVRSVRLAATGVLLAAGLSACANDRLSWDEERCIKAGLAQGTPAYNQCLARERAYLEDNRRINADLQRTYR